MPLSFDNFTFDNDYSPTLMESRKFVHACVCIYTYPCIDPSTPEKQLAMHGNNERVQGGGSGQLGLRGGDAKNL